MSCNREPSNLSPFGHGLEVVAQLETMLNAAGWSLQRATPTYTRDSSVPLSISYRLDVTRPNGKRDQVLIPESTAASTLSDYLNKS